MTLGIPARGPLLTFALAAVLPCAVPAQERPLSPVVQVAVNYAPGKSALISGVIVGGGRFVVTQANVLDNAYDIAIALTNSDVLDPAIEHVDERFNIALLRLPGVVRATLEPAADMPQGETAAVVLGAPESFVVGRSSVRLVPAPGGKRWRIVPSIPVSFRGAPILDTAGRLIGIAIEEQPGAAAVGIPVTEFLVPGAPSAIATKVAQAANEPGAIAAVAPPEPSRARSAPTGPPPAAATPPAETPSERAPEPAPPSTRPPAPAAPPVEAVARRPAPGPGAPEPPPKAAPEPKRLPEPKPPSIQLERPLAALGAAQVGRRTEVLPPAAPAPRLAAQSAPRETPPAVALKTAQPSEAAVATATESRQPAPKSQPQPPAPDPASLEAQTAANIAAWEARIRARPDDVDLRISFADALLRGSYFQGALETLEAAQARFPTTGRLYWHMAHAYWERARHKDDGARRRSLEKKSYLRARWAFEMFLKLSPDDARAPQARTLLKRLREADSGRY